MLAKQHSGDKWLTSMNLNYNIASFYLFSFETVLILF